MRIEEMAWEFVGVFDDLSTNQINEMLSKNVPVETLKFFTHYSDDFANSMGLSAANAQQLPNLLLIGYLLRVLEERLDIDDGIDDGIEP
jgi:hypothetical protein